MSAPAVAVTAGQFQAALYYSLVVAALLFLTLLGGGWALRAARRIWRGGDGPAAAILAGAALTGVLIMLGFVIAGAFGLHSMFQNG